jgi:hypothetical protein
MSRLVLLVLLSGLAAGLLGVPVTSNATASSAASVEFRSRAANGITVGQTPSAATQLSIAAPEYVYTRDIFSVIVSAQDSAGNVDANFSGTVQISADTPTYGLPVQYTYTAADAGQHLFGIIFDTDGLHRLTASDLDDPNILQGGYAILSRPLPYYGLPDRRA